MEAVATTTDNYLSLFERLEKEPGFAEHAWLRQIRRSAIARFSELGFPTTRHEEWKYTNVASIARTPYRPAAGRLNGSAASALDPVLFPGLESAQLVFVDGQFSAEHSTIPKLPRGVKVASLAAALREDPGSVEPYLSQHASYEQEAFTALNTAFMQDGAFVFIPKGVVMTLPIHLVFFSTGEGEAAVSFPRNLVLVGNGSQVTLLENYYGPHKRSYWTNTVSEIVQGENAVLDYVRLQREGDAACHIATVQLQQDRNSTFRSHAVSLGGALVRNDINAVLGAEGIDCTVNGLYVLNGRQHEDNHTRIEHAMPHCSSHELYKGILNGRSTGVFNGKIHVRKDAQKTDAKQTNKNLLLSDDATINTKPQLEIFADDVKCTHGATIGQLSEEQVFYLRSRGISHAAARNMLTTAFARDIIDRIRLEPVRTRLETDLLARLEQASA